jgi:hypothetical protein
MDYLEVRPFDPLLLLRPSIVLRTAAAFLPANFATLVFAKPSPSLPANFAITTDYRLPTLTMTMTHLGNSSSQQQ